MKTYKRKLYLTAQQQNRIMSWIEACRLVYNMSIEIKRESYKKLRLGVGKFELMKQLKDIKHIDLFSDVASGSLYDAIERVDKGYKRFFQDKGKKQGLPKFAKYKNYKSISFKEVLGIDSNRIKLPKIGWIKINKDEEIKGKPKFATIKHNCNGFYISIVTDQEIKPLSENKKAIGIDLGIKFFLSDSDNNTIENPRYFIKSMNKLSIEQRKISRMVKGSNRYNDQLLKIKKINNKISNQRIDFLHKTSTAIAMNNSTVYVENLKITNMVKFGNLSKHIQDAGWGTFKKLLAYKTKMINVDPKYTSQTCFECKEVDKNSRISQSEFICTSCGHISNADVNAAKNIMSKGIALNR